MVSGRCSLISWLREWAANVDGVGEGRGGRSQAGGDEAAFIRQHGLGGIRNIIEVSQADDAGELIRGCGLLAERRRQDPT